MPSGANASTPRRDPVARGNHIRSKHGATVTASRPSAFPDQDLVLRQVEPDGSARTPMSRTPGNSFAYEDTRAQNTAVNGRNTLEDLDIRRSTDRSSVTDRKTPVDDLEETACSPQDMIRLMRRSRGRIRGHVYVRRRESYPWQQIYCSVGRNGALRSEQEDEDALLATLIRDLRGCNVYALRDDDDSGTLVLHVRAVNGEELQLMPEQDFHNWFAALLCWQPVTTKPHLQLSKGPWHPRGLTPCEKDDAFFDQASSVIARHNAILLKETDVELYHPQNSAPTGQPTDAARPQIQDKFEQNNVVCTIFGDGKLTVQLSGQNSRSIAIVMLGELPRSAIQRLDKQLFGRQHVFGIYPQYALSSFACSRLRPFYLSFESVESFECLFVLARMFAVPEVRISRQAQEDLLHSASEALHTTTKASMSSYLRMEQSLNVTVNKINLLDAAENKDGPANAKRGENGPGSWPRAQHGHVYSTEILIDEQIKGRTMTESGMSSDVWFARHTFDDLSTSISTLSVRATRVRSERQRDKGNPNATPYIMVQDDAEAASYGDASSTEYVSGQANISMRQLDEAGLLEQWWPLVDKSGSVIGETSISTQLSRQPILAGREYEQLWRMLRDVSNGLTLKIWRHVPDQLTNLAELFLNVFQASGNAMEWLRYLATDEIRNGTRPAVSNSRKARHSGADPLESPKMHSKTANEINKRDTTIAETTVLFRANTLLTKALDAFIRRTGGAYLMATIGSKMQQILTEDLDCEVDPTKASDSSEPSLSKNWDNLMSIIEDVWYLIRRSAPECPSEIKAILHHIRSCARDQFGDVAPNVIYSSVSGFLFLRFFCAGIMNPHLFGLIDGRPRPRAQRTFLLVAKSIQGLANMTLFGAKESWMAPVNKFYTDHRQELMDFIDSICILSSSDIERLRDRRRSMSATPSPYDIPLSIYKRLPPIFKEGILSLPHLIDRPRNLAALVDLWMSNFEYKRSSLSEFRGDNSNGPPFGDAPHTLTLQTLSSILNIEDDDDDDLAQFHALCQSLSQRTRSLADDSSFDVGPVEEVIKRDGEDPALAAATQKWVKIAERMEIAPDEFWVSRVPSPPPPPVSPTAPTDPAGSPRQEESRIGTVQLQALDPNDARPNTSTGVSEARGSTPLSGVTSGKKGSRRKSSSTASGDKSSSHGDKNSSTRKKKPPPSPPARDLEQNALRKLGWI